MSIYNWIQKTIFNIYEEWHMKSSNYDRNGFHIDGINNSLKICRMDILCIQRYARHMQ